MASIGYEYEPEQESEQIGIIDSKQEYNDSNIEQYQDGYDENEECYATKLDELDKIELINRNADEINQIINPNVFNPDPLGSDPLFVKTIPPGGIKTASPQYNPPLSTEFVEERSKSLDELNNDINQKNLKNYEKAKLSNMTIQNFIKFLANSYINILNDILEINSLDDFLDVFIKDDRLIAIGILFITISIFFIFFNQF